uniref:F-box domain-containing protein n=1 Tax=Arundo donax TaxID=35708 RepID=A0A0A8YY73_ARUDO
MPPGRRGRNDKRASSIDALPDGVLEHILGFVSSEEAVRTYVLARC